MKQIYEMRGAGHSTRAIARELGLARNTVLRYLKSPEAIRPKPRSRRGSKLDPYTEHIDRRLGDGLENCVVLLRELRDLGYDGSNTILSEYVRPRRRRRQPEATMRFETEPGEQAQVDWGSLSYIGADGKQRRVWVFVMTLGWSRACYVELVRKADTAAFIQCHVNAFEYLGGVPRRCLYDNAKVVTLGRDEEKRPIWNQRMLDFALRVGFEARLCQPYRAQTKGKVENGVKYVRRNMWPSIRFTDDVDLNRQGLEWCDVVANARVHGTTHRVPWEMLAEERPHLGKLPDRATLAPYLREDRPRPGRQLRHRRRAHGIRGRHQRNPPLGAAAPDGPVHQRASISRRRDQLHLRHRVSESAWVGHGFPRDDLLTVTGGTFTSAHWLDRNTKRWAVTIRPDSQGAITVVLPKERYCATTLTSDDTRWDDLVLGAPCAAEDRRLSNQPEATIPGPSP